MATTDENLKEAFAGALIKGDTTLK